MFGGSCTGHPRPTRAPFEVEGDPSPLPKKSVAINHVPRTGESADRPGLARDSMGEERLIKGGAPGRKRTARDDVGVAIVAAVSERARLPAEATRARRHWVA